MLYQLFVGCEKTGNEQNSKKRNVDKGMEKESSGINDSVQRQIQEKNEILVFLASVLCLSCNKKLHLLLNPGVHKVRAPGRRSTNFLIFLNPQHVNCFMFPIWPLEI
jgi:hypothetical protein